MSETMTEQPIGNEVPVKRAPTVYFIDDSATMREVIKIAFRRESINVVTCADAATALAQFKQNRPDIVITDVIMPDQDGYSVCSQIKQHPEFGGVPVVLMSGVVNKSVADKAVAVHADELMRKPFQPQDLIARVKALLAPKEAARTGIPRLPSTQALENVFAMPSPVVSPVSSPVFSPKPSATPSSANIAMFSPQVVPAAPIPVAQAPEVQAPVIARPEINEFDEHIEEPTDAEGASAFELAAELTTEFEHLPPFDAAIPLAQQTEPIPEPAWPRALVEAFAPLLPALNQQPAQQSHAAPPAQSHTSQAPQTPAPQPQAAAPQPSVPTWGNSHEVSKLRAEIARLELQVKKLQTELQLERDYTQAVEQQIKTLIAG
jgi:CheY-like chemotaxis protein